jgi:riboflavin kinase/FMN adenylyltransferase
MRLYRSIEDIAPLGERHRAVAIGTFDGVHLGHQAIIGRAVAAAAEMGGVATVLTFEPHPSLVLAPESAPLILTPLELKLHLLEQQGVQEVIAVPFDRAFSGLTPEGFCRLLLSERLGARQVTVGENFRFGRGGAGTPEDLLEFGRELGFAVAAVRLMELEGEPMSSTRIRRLIQQGDVDHATRLLGRPHTLEGYVVAGAGRGRDLGSPTANLEVPAHVAVPAHGVYVTLTDLGRGTQEPGVTSVGTNPTFETDGVTRVETYLLRFSGDLYSTKVRVAFLDRLRGQIVFPDAAALIEQISRDVAAAEAHFRDAQPDGKV